MWHTWKVTYFDSTVGNFSSIKIQSDIYGIGNVIATSGIIIENVVKIEKLPEDE
jgi:hypothetical protein